ncbi:MULTISPECIES: tyrosine-type recombinase/integrase [Halorhodospira]|uniref:tyrosine-type recombinase/integrase n=1 Tax=Halorhodospira TaxID=85108 RepID=UPI001EE942B7|nr:MULTISPECIES: tyrosine-type recombinase/integrase [Halorhodospira]MCG5529066.1 tyrosine-type recombinase/integrase [Halorhodospira halophila]MCG5543181.1 tyrosine-type recombinase/integrase [Halorhodospira sp. 9628]
MNEQTTAEEAAPLLVDGDTIPIWFGWTHLWRPMPDPTQVDPARESRERPSRTDPFLAIWQTLRKEYRALTLAEPPGDRQWTTSETRTLMVRVRAHAPAGQSFLAQRRVAEVLDAGNRAGRWRIPIPDVPAPLPPAPTSPFQHNDFLAMVHHQPLVDTFLARLATPLPSEDARPHWGRIFLSALLFGGLLRTHWLWALPDALERGPAHGHWIELFDSPQDETQPQHLRWYPDPITRHLLVRARQEGIPSGALAKRHDGPALHRCIKTCTDVLGISEHLPGNWSRLLSVTRTRLALYVPPYLLAHATGFRPATSLPPSVQERLIRPPTRIAMTPPPRSADPAHRADSSEESKSTADPKATEDRDDSELWPAQLLELSRLIRRTDPPRAEPILDWVTAQQATARAGSGQPGTLLPAVQRLAEWTAHKLCTPTRRDRKPRRRSVYELYNAIAGRIAGQLADADPATLSNSDDYIELYTTALEDTVSAGSRKRVARGLRSFHEYLIEHHGAPQEPLQALQSTRFSVSRGTPDANYIDEPLFRRAIDWLDERYRDNARLSTILGLLLALGFYTGLRRSEARGVLIGDLEGPPEYALIVRPNQLRLLKSGNAQRILPLQAMLPQDLLQRLIDLQEQRRGEADTTETGPLFTLPDRGALRDNDPWLEEATRALAQVTGDPHVRFHHLRHSFASRMLVRFWELEAEGHEPPPPWASDPYMATKGAPRRLRRDLIGDEAPTQRRTLRLITRLMGHSDTQITIEHYVHTLDDLLGRSVRRICDGLTTRQLSELTGRGEAQIRDARRKTAQGTPAETLDRITDNLLPKRERLSEQCETALAPGATVGIEAPEDTIEWMSLLIHSINDHADSTDRSPQQFAFPWEADTLRRYAQTLRDLPSSLRLRARNVATTERIVDSLHDNEHDRARTTWHLLHGGGDRPGMSPRDRANLLRSFVDGYTPNTPILTVRFRTLPDLRRWVSFLDELGLLDRFIGYHTPTPGSNAAGPEKQLAHWQSALDHFPIESANERHKLDTPTTARGEVLVTLHPDAPKAVSLALFGVQVALGLSHAVSGRE